MKNSYLTMLLIVIVGILLFLIIKHEYTGNNNSSITKQENNNTQTVYKSTNIKIKAKNKKSKQLQSVNTPEIPPARELKILSATLKMTPNHADTDLIQSIVSITQKLYTQNNFQPIINYLDYSTLIKADNTKLLELTVNSYLKTGNEKDNGIYVLDLIIDNSTSSEPLKKKALFLYKKILLKEIKIALVQKNYNTALVSYNTLSSHFENDPATLLAGSKILINMGDIEGTEYLLNKINNPKQYSKEYYALQHLLTIKKQNKEIQTRYHETNIVHFTKLNNNIYVTASVNDYFDQEFILDTGASITTIPTDSLTTMGVHILPNSPVRKINTVSGTIYANEVTVDSINLNGNIVKNLKVISVDIPGLPGKGLLGMNYLNHFHTTINSIDNTITFNTKNQ